MYATIYRLSQRLLHRFNLHYMPPTYPDGETLFWCRWCGARSLMPKPAHSALTALKGNKTQ